MSAIVKTRTCTSKLLEYLQREGLAHKDMIREHAGIKRNQMFATLHDLKRKKAIDAMDIDGVLWFYATPESDTRQRQHEEIKQDIKRKRKPRPAKAKLADRILEDGKP